MTMINRIYGTGGVNPMRSDPHVTPGGSKPANGTGHDEVEFSDAARLLSRMSEVPAIRTEKVESVRQAILRGGYETPDKIDVVVDRLLKELNL